jgi:DNA repair protein RadA/Sms
MGQCPSCEEWGTLVEEPIPPGGTDSRSARLRAAPQFKTAPRLISEITNESVESRMLTGIADLDRILGGGFVAGSVVLLGGPPGVGKSTLVLQVAAAFGRNAHDSSILYISAEESAEQVSGRAIRLGLRDAPITVLNETEMERILDVLATSRCGLVVLDSIQTVRLAGLMSAAGTVAQVRECAARITEWAKTTGAIVILVGHVTKEGQLAGPKVLEHLVDVVCYLDEEPAFDLRILRSTKNRYGSSGEIGFFEMTQTGMTAITEGELPWIAGTLSSSPTIFGVVSSASRSWLTEVQALVTPTAFQFPRRIAIGLEANRLAMLLAVIEKHLKMPMSTRDVHVNVVGGMHIQDTALDLAVALSILGSFLDQTPLEPVAAIGEVGLSGEVRRVAKLKRRIGEALRYGISRIVVGGSEPGVEDGATTTCTLAQALRTVYDL